METKSNYSEMLTQINIMLAHLKGDEAFDSFSESNENLGSLDLAVADLSARIKKIADKKLRKNAVDKTEVKIKVRYNNVEGQITILNNTLQMLFEQEERNEDRKRESLLKDFGYFASRWQNYQCAIIERYWTFTSTNLRAS